MLRLNIHCSVMCGLTKNPFPATIAPITVWARYYLKCCSVRSVSRRKPDQASPALSLIMDQSDWIIHWPTQRLNDPLSHPALIFAPFVNSNHSVDTFACLWCRFFWNFFNGRLDVSQHLLVPSFGRISGELVKSCCGLLWLLWRDDFSSRRLICGLLFNHVVNLLVFYNTCKFVKIYYILHRKQFNESPCSTV